MLFYARTEANCDYDIVEVNEETWLLDKEGGDFISDISGIIDHYPILNKHGDFYADSTLVASLIYATLNNDRDIAWDMRDDLRSDRMADSFQVSPVESIQVQPHLAFVLIGSIANFESSMTAFVDDKRVVYKIGPEETPALSALYQSDEDKWQIASISCMFP